MGAWDATLKRDLEGLTVKSELIDMWRLKLTRVRSKLGVEKGAVDAQEQQLAGAKLPPPRDADGSRSTAEVLRAVKEGGREATAELLTELQRQMVEAERWRAGACPPLNPSPLLVSTSHCRRPLLPLRFATALFATGPLATALFTALSARCVPRRPQRRSAWACISKRRETRWARRPRRCRRCARRT